MPPDSLATRTDVDAWMAAFTTHRGPSERQNPRDYRGFCVKRMKGFEPSTFAMARRRSSQLSYIRKVGPF